MWSLFRRRKPSRTPAPVLLLMTGRGGFAAREGVRLTSRRSTGSSHRAWTPSHAPVHQGLTRYHRDNDATSRRHCGVLADAPRISGEVSAVCVCV